MRPASFQYMKRRPKLLIANFPQNGKHKQAIDCQRTPSTPGKASTPDTSSKNTKFIRNRSSTLKYEISKCMTQGPVIQGMKLDLRKKLLHLDGICEYCRINSARTLDHFNPLVRGGMPTEYWSDEWNTVPACTSCNSSKGGSSISEWLSSDAKRNPCLDMPRSKRKKVLDQWRRYTEACDANCVKRSIDTDLVAAMNDVACKFLNTLQTHVDRLRDDCRLDGRTVLYGEKKGSLILRDITAMIKSLTGENDNRNPDIKSKTNNDDLQDITQLIKVTLKVIE